MSKTHWFQIGMAVLAVVLAAVGVRYWTAHNSQPRLIRIGVLQLTTVDVATLEGFKAGMDELGYKEGKDISYVYHGPAVESARLAPMIEALLEEKVDLILVSSTPATQALKRAIEGSRMPAVFAPVNDPLKAGVVASLRAPGGNLTGIRLPIGDALRLEKLLQLVPRAQTVWMPYSIADASARESLTQATQAASRLGITLRTAPLNGPEGIAPMLASLPGDIDAIFLPRDSTIEARIEDFVKVAIERRLPLCTPSLTQVKVGALISYGFVHHEIGRQAARLAYQILQGIPPGELPVESAQNYLSLNLRTARDIGLEVPSVMLRQADILVR